MKNEITFDPWAQGHRIKAVVGHYGSGKTEIAMAMALLARAQGQDTTLCDMDIVNPFFRSAEQHDKMKNAGIRTINPPYALTGLDLPVLSAEVQSIFGTPGESVVLDIGGDDAGAAALGRYKPHFDKEGCDVFYVVNLFRPFSETKEKIIAMMDRIARRSRLAPSGLINNTNLGAETQAEHILAGQRVLDAVSSETGVPIVAISGLQSVLDTLPSMDAPLFPIERLTMPEWMA